MVSDVLAGKCDAATNSLTQGLDNSTLDRGEVNEALAENDLFSQILNPLEQTYAIEEPAGREIYYFDIVQQSTPGARPAAATSGACPPYYFDLNGKRIIIQGIQGCTVSVNGVLMGFSRNGEEYIPIRQLNGRFMGYYRKSDFYAKKDTEGRVALSELLPAFTVSDIDYVSENSAIRRFMNFFEENEHLIKGKENYNELLNIISTFPEQIFQDVEGKSSPFLFDFGRLKTMLLAYSTQLNSRLTILRKIFTEPNFYCDDAGENDDLICKVNKCVYNKIGSAYERDLLNGSLDIETRKKLISLLASHSLTTGTLPDNSPLLCAASASSEFNLLSLIKTTPSTDVYGAGKLIEHLKSALNGRPVLEVIISKISSALYPDLMLALSDVESSSQQAVQHYLKLSTNEDIEKRMIFLHNNDLFAENYIGKIKYKIDYENGKVKVKKEQLIENKAVTYYDPAFGNVATTIPVWKEENYELDPFDYVIVRNQSRLSTLENEMNIGYNDVVVVPAIFLQYAYDKQTNYQILQGVKVGAEVLSLAAGGGLVVAAVRTGGAALASYEAASVLATAIASGGDLSIDIGAVDPQSTVGKTITVYSNITAILTLTGMTYQQLPRLEGWVRKLASLPQNFQIPRNLAQQFVSQYKAAVTDVKWKSLSVQTMKKLGAMNDYLLKKGLVAGQVVVDGLLSTTRLAKTGTLKQALGIALITGFSFVKPAEFNGILKASNLNPVTSVIGISNKALALTDDFQAFRFSRIPEISGKITSHAESFVSELNVVSAAGMESGVWGAALMTGAQVQLAYMAQGAFELLQLTINNPLTGQAEQLLLAKKKDDGSDGANCEVCKTARPKLCKLTESLWRKAGAAATTKKIIESKLCLSSLSDVNLTSILGVLLGAEFTAEETKTFLNDLNNSACTSDQICGNIGGLSAEVVGAWGYLFQHHLDANSKKDFAPNSRKNWNTLTWFTKLNVAAKAKVVLFSDSESKRLINFCADLQKTHNGLLFMDFVNDEKNDKYVRGFVKSRLTETEQQDLEGILADWTIQKDENPEVEKWLLYGENSSRFQRNRTLGNQLSTSILTNLKTRSGSLYQQLITLTGIPKVELDKYEILDEVPLNTIGGFMKTDILFIKRSNLNPLIIDDALILENKLSNGTDYTERQVEGFKAILNGQTSMVVNYIRQGLNSGTPIPVSKNKIFKFYDHGKNDIGQVSIKLITSLTP